MKKLSFINSGVAVKIAQIIGRILPMRTGYILANKISDTIGNNKKTKIVQAIRTNQSVIHGFTLCEEELDIITHEVLRNAGMCLFDYYYFLTKPEKILSQIDLDHSVIKIIERIKNKQPTILVAPHTSNFDLMGCALHLLDVPLQILSYPNPKKGYQLQNRIRKEFGLEVTPISLSSFRMAKNRLREGGCILTGLDRPLDDSGFDKYKPRFFGYPCQLPVFYTRFALDLNIPVCLIACVRKENKKYSLVGSDFHSIQPKGSLYDSIIRGTEEVLQEAEEVIYQYSTQWSMFYKIWIDTQFQQTNQIKKEVFL